MKRTLSLLLLSVALLATRSARAASIEDGRAFGMDVADVRLCVVAPAEKRSNDGCEGLKLDPTKLPSQDKPGKRAVLSAFARRGTAPEAPVALLHVQRQEIENASDLDPMTMGGLVQQGITEGMRKVLPPGTRVREPVGSVVAHRGWKAYRSVIDVDGIPESAPSSLALIAHQVVYVIPTEPRGIYVIGWSTTRENAATFDALATASIATAHVERPAQPRAAKVSGAIADLVISVLELVVFLAAIVMIIWAVIRSQRVKRGAMVQAPYGPPPYGPPSYPQQGPQVHPPGGPPSSWQPPPRR